LTNHASVWVRPEPPEFVNLGNLEI